MELKDIIKVLLAKHLPEVRSKLSLFRGYSNEWKDDVLQNACVKVLENYDKLEDVSKFKAWFMQIAVNTGRNMIRDQKERIMDEAFFSKIPDEQKTSEQTIIEDDLLDIIANEMQNLPPKQRRAFILRVTQGLTFTEIAQKMDCPYDTAKANYRHGMLAVKIKLNH